MIDRSAIMSRSLALCLASVVAMGCASVPKTTSTEHDNRTQRVDQKHDIVRDYEDRRNDIQFQAALSQAQQGDPQGAQKALALLLERSPKHRPAHLLACELALELADPQAATDLANRLVAFDPNDADAHHLLGLALEAKGLPTEATSHYRRAAELAPENEVFVASWELASSAEAQVEAPTSSAFGVQLVGYDEPIDSAESSPLEAGHRALATGSIEDAERHYGAAMAAAPDNPNIPREAALRLLQHNETIAAVRLSKHASRQFPRSVPLLRTLATAQYRQGDYESSQVALQQALSLDNRDALAYFLMGAVREKLGDHQGAALSTAKAHELRSAISAR